MPIDESNGDLHLLEIKKFKIESNALKALLALITNSWSLVSCELTFSPKPHHATESIVRPPYKSLQLMLLPSCTAFLILSSMVSQHSLIIKDIVFILTALNAGVMTDLTSFHSSSCSDSKPLSKIPACGLFSLRLVKLEKSFTTICLMMSASVTTMIGLRNTYHPKTLPYLSLYSGNLHPKPFRIWCRLPITGR